MNDEELPRLSAADEARIRALLADARLDEPMPDAVVARLDRVLAGLAEEAPESPVPATVVSLTERRHRAARMLVAAAAVVVAGVGIGQVVGNSGGSPDSLSAGRAGAGGDSPLAPEAERSFSGGSSGGSGPASSPQSDSLDSEARAFRLRPRHFARDSRGVQARAMKLADSAELSATRSPVAQCQAGSWGAGRYVPVEYGRAPGYLVLRRPGGDSQVADLFLCGGTQPVRSITLPGP